MSHQHPEHLPGEEHSHLEHGVHGVHPVENHGDHHEHDASHDSHTDAGMDYLKNLAIKTLIVVGVIIAITIGSWIVIRIVPSVVASLAAVSVSVSSLFQPATNTPAQNTPVVSNVNQTDGPVLPNPFPSPTTTPPTTSSIPSIPGTKAVAGKPDLTVSILGTGVLDKVTGTYIVKTTVGTNERAAIRFQITNSGTKATGSWNFSVLMPTEAQKNVYTSPAQRSLNPGESILYTLGFDGISNYSNAQVVVSADEGNTLSEIRKDNNIASTRFNLVGYAPTAAPIYGAPIQVINGTPDLAVRIVNFGSMDRYTGAYTPVSSINQYQKIGVKIVVSNIGTTHSGLWTFTASLPSSNQGTFNGGTNPSLRPGESVELIVGFENINAYQGSVQNIFSVNIDPYNSIREINEGNNYTSIAIPTIYAYNAYNQNQIYYGQNYNNYDPYNPYANIGGIYYNQYGNPIYNTSYPYYQTNY